MPKISVIVPIYNVEKYLRECLDSIINQTFEDLEIILLDDGGQDSCPQIIDEYAASDKRIVAIHKENGGYGHTMNVGLSRATGEYVGIVEPDDYVHPRMYQRLYELAENMNLDIIKADFCRVYDKNGSRKIERVRLSGNAADYGRICNPYMDRNLQARIFEK